MIKKNILFSALALSLLLSSSASALPCWLCAFVDPTLCIGDDPGPWGYCISFTAATAGLHSCYPKGSKGWWICAECPPSTSGKNRVHCADYEIKWVCEQDPCDAIPGPDVCQWAGTEDDGYCHSGCGGKPETECRENDCLPDYDKSGNFYRCIDCPVDMECSKYKKTEDCSANPCRVMGACMWWGSSCVEDSDKDGCPDRWDNCPGKANMVAASRDMPNNYCETDTGCDNQGDACDDTDGDGLTDQYEVDHGLNPLNTESSVPPNCISDGVEYIFDPLIYVLSGVAVAIAAAMLAYLALGWLTSDSPAKRDNAKKGVIYIVAGLLLLAGGKDLVIFLLQDVCPMLPNIGFACSCTKACPTAPAPTDPGSSPFIYSFNGQRFYLEHDGYPFAVLPAWEYESFGRMIHLAEDGGRYRVRITEELRYTTYTNRLRLLAVDHPENVLVYPDLDGGVHTIADPVKPSSCVEEDGTDCSAAIEDDGIYWMSSTDDKNLSDSDADGVVDVYNPDDLYDGIILSYPNPNKATHAKLLLKVRESGAVGVAWHSFLNTLGQDDAAKLARLSAKEPLRTALTALRAREGLYSVRVWDGRGWVLEESFGVGPLVPSEMVIPLTVPAEDTVKVKLDSAVLAYETDYAVLDYNPDASVTVRELAPEEVTSRSSVRDDDALTMIKADDTTYLPISTGEYVDVYFPVPEQTGPERSFIIGIKGYYIAEVTTKTERSLAAAETIIRFVFDPTYAIRYSYVKYLRMKQ